MGQYWIPVNLDKREFVQPHKLGAGLKLWEQVANHPGTGAALLILCAAMPEVRGGGDLDLEENWHGPERIFPEHNCKPGPMPEDYAVIAKRTIGRWAGNRIALIGDYAERSDLPEADHADLIYSLCCNGQDRKETITWMEKRILERDPEAAEEAKDQLERYQSLKPYRDITNDVAAVIEHELGGKYEGDGWREWKEATETESVQPESDERILVG